MQQFAKKQFNKLQVFLDINFTYIARGGMWLGIDQIASIVISVVLTIAFGNLLPQEVFGTYRYIISLFGILTIFTLPNMNLALTTSVAKRFEGLFQRALRVRIAWGFIGAVVALALGGYFFVTQKIDLAYSMFIMAVFLPFMDSFNLYEGFLKGKQRFQTFTIYSLVTRSTSAITLIVTLFVTDNLFTILLSFFIPYLITRIVFFMRTSEQVTNTKEDPELIRYGKHLSFMQVINVAVNYVDNILIFHFLGPIALAIYSIAMAPISRLQKVFSILPQLALPKFSEMTLPNIKLLMKRYLMKIVVVVGIGIVVYVILIPVAFRIFLPQYTDSIYYSQILVLVLIGLPFSLMYTALQAQTKIKELYQYNIGIRIAQLIFTIILVSLYGIFGAVFARIGFQFISLWFLVVLFRRIS